MGNLTPLSILRFRHHTYIMYIHIHSYVARHDENEIQADLFDFPFSHPPCSFSNILETGFFLYITYVCTYYRIHLTHTYGVSYPTRMPIHPSIYPSIHPSVHTSIVPFFPQVSLLLSRRLSLMFFFLFFAFLQLWRYVPSTVNSLYNDTPNHKKSIVIKRESLCRKILLIED